MAEAVHIPAHLAPPESLKPKQLHHLYAQSSLGQSCHRQKNPKEQKTVLYLCVRGRFSHIQLFATLWMVACQVSLSGGSLGKNTGVYWAILVVIPFYSTIFPAFLATNSPEYLVLPEPLQPKQLHHLHTWPSLRQTQVLPGSLRSKPEWMTHMQRWK